MLPTHLCTPVKPVCSLGVVAYLLNPFVHLVNSVVAYVPNLFLSLDDVVAIPVRSLGGIVAYLFNLFLSIDCIVAYLNLFLSIVMV